MQDNEHSNYQIWHSKYGERVALLEPDDILPEHYFGFNDWVCVGELESEQFHKLYRFFSELRTITEYPYNGSLRVSSELFECKAFKIKQALGLFDFIPIKPTNNVKAESEVKSSTDDKLAKTDNTVTIQNKSQQTNAELEVEQRTPEAEPEPKKDFDILNTWWGILLLMGVIRLLAEVS
jgi:hypothetical protein